MCLMNWTLLYHISRAIFGMDPIKQHRLCALCDNQLTESAKQTPPSNLRFVGPVLVRSETNYQVLSLPDRVKIIAGEVTDQDCLDFAFAVRAEAIPPKSDEMRVDWLLKDEVRDKPDYMADTFNRARKDPLEAVRMTTPKTFAHFYVSRAQFTNAINICREAMTSNPNDDWSYNLLAWLQATCPDSSVRNGKEAIALASKACELTHWQESSWIDTLAAARAESGDFQRAIQFEEQALRTGNPPESEEKAMRERLSLYKQSQPYREKPPDIAHQ
jgi:tetratricopeptide (TPR) repeat protein